MDAEYKYVRDVLLKQKARASLAVQRSYELLLYRACSFAWTEELEFLLAHLDIMSSPLEYPDMTNEDYQRRLVYDCLTIARQKKQNHVIRTLTSFTASKPVGMSVTRGSSKYHTLLHWAAVNGDVEVITRFIEAGVDVNHKNSNGETALHFACDSATAEALLIKGADVHAKSSRNETPLFYACVGYRLGVVRKLLENGAEAYVGSVVIPLHIAGELHAGFSIANALLQFNVQPKELKVSPSCVWGAMEDGELDMLCSTCKNENQPIVDRVLAIKIGFLEKKSCSYSLRSRNEVLELYPPLHLAISEVYKKKVAMNVEDLKIITTHLSKDDFTIVNSLNKSGTTALYLASERNLIEVARLLLDSGANPNLSSSQKYPLIIACRYLCHEFVRLLLDREADTKVADSSGASPLCIATASRDLHLVKMLVEHGADVKYRDPQGRSVIQYLVDDSKKRLCQSSEVYSIEIFRYLLDNGVKVSPPNTVVLRHIIDSIACSVNTGSFSRGAARFQLIQILLERGADVVGCVATLYVNYRWFEATRARCSSVFQELLRHGCIPNWSRKGIGGLLSLACSYRDIRFVRILLAAGADPNLMTWDWSVFTCVMGNEEMVDLMVNKYGWRLKVPSKQFLEFRFYVFGTRSLPYLTYFFIPFCKGAHRTILMLQAGSSFGFLQACCQYSYTLTARNTCCHLGGRLCKAIVLAGHKTQQQHLVEKLKQSERRHDRDLASWLEQDSLTPPSLLRLSRVAVRSQLSTASEYRTILPLIKVLPIPHLVRKYLSFEGPLSEVDLNIVEASKNCECQKF